MSHIECLVCISPYDETSRRPRILYCGHTFCSSCLTVLWEYEVVKCPECRTALRVLSIEDLPVNFSLLHLATKQSQEINERSSVTQDTREAVCPTHKKSIDAYCESCEDWVCEECIEKEHVEPRGCKIVSISGSIKKLKHLNLNAIEESLSLLTSEMVQINKAHAALKSQKEILEGSLWTLEKEERKLNTEITDKCSKREDLIAMKDLIFEADSVTKIEKVSRLIKILCNEIRRIKDWEWKVTSNTIDNLIKSSISTSTLAYHLISQMKECNMVATYETYGDNKFARVSCYDNKITLHAITSEQPPDDSFKLPSYSIRNLVKVESAQVFIDILIGSSSKRLVIKMLGSNTRSRQFVKRCTGELDPGLIGTSFQHIDRKGEGGESIVLSHKPNLITPDQQRSQGLHFNKNKSCIVEGMVATNDTVESDSDGLAISSSGDQPQTDKVYRFYLRTDSSTSSESVFAQVENIRILDSLKKGDGDQIVTNTVVDSGVFIPVSNAETDCVVL